MENPSILDPYEAQAARLRAFGPALEDLMRQVLRVNKVRFHSVTHRVKQRSSAFAKISRQTGQKYQSVSDLTDLLGIRIITYFPDDVDKVAELIESEFQIDWENSIDKSELLDPDRFGYLSRHYIASLDHRRQGLVEYATFSDCVFEAQIRSILQHTWAEIEHDLGYKSPISVPRSVKRRFARLAGLLELADDEFVGIRDALAEHSKEVTSKIQTGHDLDIEIDRDSVFAFIQQNPLLEQIDREIIAGCSSTRERPSKYYAGSRVKELHKVNLDKIKDIVHELDRRHSSIVERAVTRLTTPGGSEKLEHEKLEELTSKLDGSSMVIDFISDDFAEEFPEEEIFELHLRHLEDSDDPIEFNPDEASATGVWPSLPAGISLFYLYEDICSDLLKRETS